MKLKKIRLEMARNEGFPNGSRNHGYELITPLDHQDHLDPVAWEKCQEKCRVVRFWGHDAHKAGHLIYSKSGNWSFHYDVKGDEMADDRGFKFNTEPFQRGEYISIIEPDGNEMIFQVTSVQDVSL